MMKFKISVLLTTLLSVGLVACNENDNATNSPEVVEATPETIKLSLLGRYETKVFVKSAAEIPAYDAASKRLFVVNAQKGLVDVLDASKPAQPVHIAELSARTYLANSEVNSVAVKNGIVAIAVQAQNKTDTGIVVLFNAKDLSFISKVSVGALPDMLTFSPDAKTVLVANEAEPNDDYSVDPEGSISIIDISNIQQPKASVAGFSAWNNQKSDLLAKGVRIFGPNASVAQDLEPEYITISADSKTAWVTLQENNAIARIDIAQQKVTDIYPLGYKDHSLVENALDVSDRDCDPKTDCNGDGVIDTKDKDKGMINIKPWEGLVGMYQPDSIANYQVNGQTYLVTANEGDSRAWLKDAEAYFGGDTSKGFVEEIRVKDLFKSSGFTNKVKDEYPAHLQKIAVQRVSAVVLAAYTVVLFGWILCNSGFGYEQWAGFMLTLPMKIFSLLAVLSLVAHAWIGMWQVFTDYVTTRQMGPSASGLRLVLTTAVIISVFVYAIWGIQIFWAN